MALAAVLAQPWADTVLSGAASPAQLRANLVATRTSLTPDDLAELAELAQDAEAYWADRAALPWD